jgi:glyoxylase-like metal-dependent hydrolase (beta-lactamase superfamily II)
MRFCFFVAVATLGLFAFSAGAEAQGIDYAKAEIITTQVAPNVYVLTGSPNVDPGHPEGAGGRIGVLVGPQGVLMVDAQYAPLGDKVLAAIRKLSDAPIRYLIDTHEHPDHTGGNPTFAKLGAVIFAREETREELEAVPPPAVVKAIGDAADLTDPARLPVVTYGLGSTVRIYLDGETVDLISAAASHTDGDTIVRFEKANVMMIGDFYRNYGYPFVDPRAWGHNQGCSCRDRSNARTRWARYGSGARPWNADHQGSPRGISRHGRGRDRQSAGRHRRGQESHGHPRGEVDSSLRRLGSGWA